MDQTSLPVHAILGRDGKRVNDHSLWTKYINVRCNELQRGKFLVGNVDLFAVALDVCDRILSGGPSVPRKVQNTPTLFKIYTSITEEGHNHLHTHLNKYMPRYQESGLLLCPRAEQRIPIPRSQPAPQRAASVAVDWKAYET